MFPLCEMNSTSLTPVEVRTQMINDIPVFHIIIIHYPGTYPDADLANILVKSNNSTFRCNKQIAFITHLDSWWQKLRRYL